VNRYRRKPTSETSNLPSSSASSAVFGVPSMPFWAPPKSPTNEDSFVADYGRMHSPVFAAMSKSLAHTVPKNAGFGRFRGGE
jgi:hypothetical protein